MAEIQASTSGISAVSHDNFDDHSDQDISEDSRTNLEESDMSLGSEIDEYIDTNSVAHLDTIGFQPPRKRRRAPSPATDLHLLRTLYQML